MSTPSYIGYRTSNTARLVSVRSDGDPQWVGRTLLDLLTRSDWSGGEPGSLFDRIDPSRNKPYLQVWEYLLNESPAGWKNVGGADFRLAAWGNTEYWRSSLEESIRPTGYSLAPYNDRINRTQTVRMAEHHFVDYIDLYAIEFVYIHDIDRNTLCVYEPYGSSVLYGDLMKLCIEISLENIPDMNAMIDRMTLQWKDRYRSDYAQTIEDDCGNWRGVYRDNVLVGISYANEGEEN